MVNDWKDNEVFCIQLSAFQLGPAPNTACNLQASAHPPQRLLGLLALPTGNLCPSYSTALRTSVHHLYRKMNHNSGQQ